MAKSEISPPDREHSNNHASVTAPALKIQDGEATALITRGFWSKLKRKITGKKGEHSSKIEERGIIEQVGSVFNLSLVGEQALNYFHLF